MSTTEKEHLEAKREELALALAEGQPVEDELEHVEYELDMLALEQGRAADRTTAAERARARREQEQATRAEAERRRALEERFTELEARRIDAARKVDAAADGLAEVLAELAAAGEAMYRTRLELGENHPRLRLGEIIAAYVQWRTVPFAPSIGRPDRFYRRPLVEILGGAPSPASEAEGPRAPGSE